MVFGISTAVLLYFKLYYAYKIQTVILTMLFNVGIRLKLQCAQITVGATFGRPSNQNEPDKGHFVGEGSQRPAVWFLSLLLRA